MKRKYAAALVALGVVALSLAALALENGASNGAGVVYLSSPRLKAEATERSRVYLLKSNGKVIAELRAAVGTGSELSSTGQAEYNVPTGTLVARNGVALKIIAGTNSVSVTADEIETVAAEK